MSKTAIRLVLPKVRRYIDKLRSRGETHTLFSRRGFCGTRLATELKIPRHALMSAQIQSVLGDLRSELKNAGRLPQPWPHHSRADVRRLEEFLADLFQSHAFEDYIDKGKLNCRKLSSVLKIPRASLLYAIGPREVIRRYNSRLRELGYDRSKWDFLVRRIDEWLTSLQASDRLPVSHVAGRLLISRAAVNRHFGISNLLLCRYPAIRDVLLRWDKKIDPQLYRLRYKYAGKVPELRSILQEPPTYRGKLNRTAIACSLGISWLTLNATPELARLLDEAEERLTATRCRQISIDTITGSQSVRLEFEPYVARHKRRYSFFPHVNLVQPTLLYRIAKAFAQIAAAESAQTAKHKFLVLRWFFQFIGRGGSAAFTGAEEGVGKFASA